MLILLGESDIMNCHTGLGGPKAARHFLGFSNGIDSAH
jgi:hypothetical protein